MKDLLAVVGLIAFFALSAGFVVVCARIIGPDPEGVVLSSGPGDEPAALGVDTGVDETEAAA